MNVDPEKARAVQAVVAVLRNGGRTTVRAVCRDVHVTRKQALRALTLAEQEQLVFSRDRNVWTATAKARAAFDEGQRATVGEAAA